MSEAAFRPRIRTVPDVTAEALELIVPAMRAAAAARGRVVLNLSGGSTPKPLYEALARVDDLPWSRTRVLLGDERHVPPAHPRSNLRALREALLDRVPVPPSQVLAWPWREALEPEEAADEFASTLRSELGDPPEFDVVLLGLGDDAHTASLFPGTGAARATGLTAAVRTDAQPEPRVTLTAEALSRGRLVLFLVSGEGKRAALEGTLSGAGDLDRYPARAIGATERLVVVTDIELDGAGGVGGA